VTIALTWLKRHTGGVLIAVIFGLGTLIGCGGGNKNKEKEKEIPIVYTSDSTLKPYSISGTVGIAVCNHDNCYMSYMRDKSKKCQPVANIVVRAFQWHYKDGIKEYNPPSVSNGDQAADNAKFGAWKLVGTTTTNSNGHYTLEGVLTPGYATFVEVISVCRPTDPMLPTTTIIADLDQGEDPGALEDESLHWYGKSDISREGCPKGLVCSRGQGGFSYPVQSRLTKDDRIVYSFRRPIVGDEYLRDNAVPEPPSSSDNDYDGNINPVVNFILDDDSSAGISPEKWYEYPSYIPIFRLDEITVGTSIVRIIDYLNNAILSRCKNNKDLVKGTLVDIHYYPHVSSNCKMSMIKGDCYDKSNPKDEEMPLGFNRYNDTDLPHYYVSIPPILHLKRCPGECYPERFKTLLLKSGLFRPAAKGEYRDLNKEGSKACDEDDEEDEIDIRENNCYK
jgi:hypothetical protein